MDHLENVTYAYFNSAIQSLWAFGHYGLHHISDLVLNHAADLGQEVLADDAVKVAVLWGGFVLDALCQTEPLLLCITHKGPSASLTAWQN